MDVPAADSINQGSHVARLHRARGLDDPRHMFLFLDRENLSGKKTLIPGRVSLRVVCPRPDAMGPAVDVSLIPLKPVRGLQMRERRLRFSLQRSA
jgi:hypothetical protein